MPQIYSPGESWPWPASYGPLAKDNRDTLAVLRLVDKAFCRSASRALFRYKTIRTKLDSTFIPKFEEFASSDCALFVRYIDINIDFQWDEKDEAHEVGQHNGAEEVSGRGFGETFDQVVNRLPFLLSKFVKLQSFHIWQPHFEYEERLVGLVLPVLRAMADLQVHDLTELGLPLGSCIPFLHGLLKDSVHEIAVTRFMQRIRHLCLQDYQPRKDNMIGLCTMLNTTINLCTLEISGAGLKSDLVLDKIDSCQALPLEFLDLHYLSISSNHLLGLLEKCKHSMRFITIAHVNLTSGSWLHVLSQISKNLKLFVFLWEFRKNYENEKEYQYSNSRRPLDLFDKEDQHQLNWCVHGEIQRQIIVNRRASGIELISNSIIDNWVNRPSLRSVMKETQYQELMSRPWDFEKHSN